MRTLFLSLVPLRYTGFTRNYLAQAATRNVVRHLVPRASERSVIERLSPAAPTSFLSFWAIAKALFVHNWDAVALFGRRTWLFVRTREANGSQKHRVLPPLVDHGQYQYHPDLSALYRLALSLKGSPVVGQVGDFTKRNKQNFTLSVFRELRAINPDAHLLLIGDGPLRMELAAQIDYEYLPAAMPGNTLSMHTMLTAMDVLLLPADSADPYLLDEARAAGLPCIISSHTGAGKAENVIALDMDPKRWAEAIVAFHASGARERNRA